jgi:hypothetical protein
MGIASRDASSLAASPNRPVRPNCALDFGGSSDGATATVWPTRAGTCAPKQE